jgi:hypothetical protein
MAISGKTNERRNSPRTHECSDYFLMPGTERAEPFILKNISVTGACIVTDIPLTVHQILDVHICRNRDLKLRSQVVWIKGNEYGLSFMLDTEESFKAISFIMNNSTGTS